MSYFSIVCYVWAAVGIGSRIAMAVLGKEWSTWETGKAYTSKRPAWVLVVASAGLLLIAYTWYRVFSDGVSYSWIIAALISLTGIKAGMLLFRYDQFRDFVVRTLADASKMRKLNVSVLILSAALVAMGLFLY